jgi:cation diffusion facilitator CzcD-associated flavoprotein CzcO
MTVVPHPRSHRPVHGIIGAGLAGLPLAAALLTLGDEVEILDRNPEVGGLWFDGAYTEAHLISSRRATEFPTFPMPPDWPDFPSRAQMAEYLARYADAAGLRPHVRLGTDVTSVRPADGDGWEVRSTGGTVRRYATVTLAVGQYYTPRPVALPGIFTGDVLTVADYRDTSAFAGRRVLVVGHGNTGCDVAADASRVAASTVLSMRSGAYVLPKTFAGIPTIELLSRLPVRTNPTDRVVARIASRLATGDLRRHGFPRPSYRILDRNPVINDELPQAVRHGRLRIRPGIAKVQGRRVWFDDGTADDIDVLFWAAGYRIALPMLPTQDSLLDWHDGVPVLHTDVAAPRHRGLFVAGLGRSRTGAGPLFEARGRIIARMAAHDARSRRGVTADIDADPRARMLRRLLRRPWVAPVDMRSHGHGELDRRIAVVNRMLDAVGCPRVPSVTLPGRLGPAPARLTETG